LSHRLHFCSQLALPLKLIGIGHHLPKGQTHLNKRQMIIGMHLGNG
jgi:hypothetical protein